MRDDWKTRRTLIQRARDPDDPHAWEEFVGYYKEFIHMLLRQLQVPADELEDMRQVILVKLWENLGTVKLDESQPKFRTWLGTVIRNTVYTHNTQAAARRRRESESIASESAPNDLEDLIEQEWKQHVIRLAMQTLEGCFSGKAIDVFMMTLDGKPVAEIQEKLELTRDTVYVLRNRVRSRFHKEIRRLRADLELGG